MWQSSECTVIDVNRTKETHLSQEQSEENPEPRKPICPKKDLNPIQDFAIGQVGYSLPCWHKWWKMWASLHVSEVSAPLSPFNITCKNLFMHYFGPPPLNNLTSLGTTPNNMHHFPFPMDHANVSEGIYFHFFQKKVVTMSIMQVRCPIYLSIFGGYLPNSEILIRCVASLTNKLVVGGSLPSDRSSLYLSPCITIDVNFSFDHTFLATNRVSLLSMDWMSIWLSISNEHLMDRMDCITFAVWMDDFFLLFIIKTHTFVTIMNYWKLLPCTFLVYK